MTDSVALKAQLRLVAAERRDALEIDDRLEWDQQIADQVLGLDLLAAADGAVAGYWPMRSEADPRPIMVALRDRGVALGLPAMVRPADGAAQIAFRNWTPWEPIVPGGFGTLVPPEDQPVMQPAVLLVPLLAFDSRCRRIGYGKGHYDRAITKLRAQGPLLAIGIAYAAQQVDAVPIEAHDQHLDAIVTEAGVLRGS
jgi:5-formyltetrahydrofolate cyclo-ligase